MSQVSVRVWDGGGVRVKVRDWGSGTSQDSGWQSKITLGRIFSM